ncbi:glycosyltransferase [Bradyrhizobium sp. AUGA SZCCT0431]|uniref:glycosyltransferase n=1 Tax=Bradyrhizobium sp. AUGA SZCCT0431 TaxID=2807674 RepID=UPI00289D69C0|nr:glycosyltransferase [Bradyrhizobium sp. AUGA SZCCT0431]
MCWRSERDNGQSDAINKGFANVDCDIMAYLNSDDTLLPGTLASVADFFEQRPDVDFVYGHRIFIDYAGSEIGRAVFPVHDSEALKYADHVLAPSRMGQGGSDEHRISFGNGLGLHAARRGRRLQDGTAAAFSRLFPCPRRTGKTTRNYERGTGGNAGAASAITRACPEPASNLSLDDALPGTTVRPSLELSPRPREAMIRGTRTPKQTPDTPVLVNPDAIKNNLGLAKTSPIDFLEGRIYVLGVGVAGGMALRNRRINPSPARP